MTISAATTADDTQATSGEHPVLARDARLGAARIAVTDLDRSVRFYQEAIGLDHLGTEGSVARMGSAGDTVLELAEERDARRPGRHAGLYHVALLYPSRLELGRVGRRLVAQRVPIQGASDHLTHEAFYLPDPDGNGLELAADRPRDQWPSYEGQYSGGPQPMDVDGVLALTDGEGVQPRAADGVVVGHLHLHVGDLEEAVAFYRDVVGLDIVARLPSAAFAAVGGYHHHLGMNTWRGEGVPAAPQDALGLRWWTMLVPERSDVQALVERLRSAGIEHELLGSDGVAFRDPWGAQLRVLLDGTAA